MVGHAAAAGLGHLSGARRRRADSRTAEQHDRRRRAGLAGRTDDCPQHAGYQHPPCAGRRVGTTSLSTVRPVRSWRTRTCGWPSPRVSTGRPSPTSRQRGLVDKPAPLNNHIFVAGQKGYQDNSAVVAYDPEKAKAELDALGWRLNGQFREKDGRQLVIRDVLYDAQSTRQFAPDRAEQPRPDRRQAGTRRQGRRQLLQPVHQHRGLRHRPVELGGRRVPAVLPDPDLRLGRGKQLRQDRHHRRSTPRSSRCSTSSTRTRRAHWPTNSIR